jgi:tetratricopeptide (TPR) repeat protein
MIHTGCLPAFVSHQDHFQAHKAGCTIVLCRKVKEAKDTHGTEDCIAVADARRDAGEAYFHNGCYADAERCFLKVIPVYRATYGAAHLKIARLHSRLGQVYSAQEREEEALQEHAESMMIVSILGDASLPQAVKELVSCRLRFCQVLDNQGLHGQALACLQESQRILRDNGMREDHLMAGTLSAMANAYFHLEDYSEAINKHKMALHILRLEDNSGPGGKDTQYDVATELMNLGMAYQSEGMLDEAGSSLSESLELLRRIRGSNHPAVAATLQSIGHLHYQQGKHGTAAEMLLKSIKIYRRALGNDSQEVGLCLSHLAAIEKSRGSLDKSLQMNKDALRIKRLQKGRRGDIGLANALHNVGLDHVEIGMLEEGLENFREALSVTRAVHGNEHLEVARALRDVAVVLERMDDTDQALAMSREAIEIYMRVRDQEGVDDVRDMQRRLLQRPSRRASRDHDGGWGAFDFEEDMGGGRGCRIA